MLQQFFLLAVVVSSFVAFMDWRLGCYLLIAVAAVQDPIRKSIPGAPGYLVLATAPIWSVIVFSSFSKMHGLWRHFKKYNQRLSSAIILFLISLAPASFMSATYGHNSWMMTLVGLYSYGSVLCGWLIGYAYQKRSGDIRKLLSFYCFVTSIMLIGTPIEYLGILKWPALGTTAMGHEWIRHVHGYQVKMIAGFYRSPDVMGWHAVMITMIAILLVLSGKGIRNYLWGFIASWGIAMAILCGRRKMVLMIPVFCITLIWLYWWAKSRSRTAVISGALLIVMITGYIAYDQIGRNPEVEKYYISTIREAPERITQHGYNALIETYRQSGFFGEGVGTAAQGTHHLTVQRPRTWQEGGLSRILVELGVPGLICFLVLAIILAMRMIWLITRHLRLKTSEFPIMAGLVAILFANAGSFVVSHQIFGDPFIIIFFSLLVGFLLSASRESIGESQGRGAEVGGG